MATLNQQQVNDIMVSALRKWQPSLISALQAAAAKRKIGDSVINSLAATVINGDAKTFGKLMLFFQSYGRFPDIKNVDYSTSLGPPAEALADWVKKRGVSNFKRIPGYENSKSELTEDENAKRIAWGISFHRRSVQFKHKRKIWYNKTFMKSYNELQDLLMKEYTDFVAAGMVATFN